MAKQSPYSHILKGPILNIPNGYFGGGNSGRPTFMASSTNVNAFYTVAGQPPNTVGHPHILKIVNHNEDVGQDGYMEDYDWNVIHPHECEKMTVTHEMLSRGNIPLRDILIDPYRDPLQHSEFIYVCKMAKELEQFGLERLSVLWTDLEVGEYNIVLEESAGGYNNTGQVQVITPSTYRIALL